MLEQHSAQAFGDEIVYLGYHRRALQRLRGGSGMQNFHQIEIQPGFEQNAQHAQRGAPQAKRILGARRPLLDGKDPHQRVDLVGQRYSLAGAGARYGIAGKSRPVVLFERQRQVLRFALRLGVVAPHRALQLRELADHGGHQVRLAERRRAPHVRPCSDAAADQLRELRDACGLVGIAAELGLKRHACKRRRMLPAS